MLRLISAAAVVAATVALVPAPALAAPADTGYSLSAPDIGFSDTGSFVPVVLNTGHAKPKKITNVQMTLDATGIQGFATAAVPNVCGTTGRPVGCIVGTIDTADRFALPQVLVVADQGVAPGRSGRLKITVTGDGLEPLVVTPTVTVDDVRVIVRWRDRGTEKPGALINAPIRVSNAGPDPVRRALVRFDADPKALRWLLDYKNCWPLTGGSVVCDLPDAVLRSIPYQELPERALQVLDEAAGNRDYRARTTWWAGSTADAVAEVLIPGAQVNPGRPELKLTTPPQDDCCGTPTAPPSPNQPWTASAEMWVSVVGGAQQTPPSSPPATSPSQTPPAEPGDDNGETPGAGAPAPGQGGGLPITGTNTVLAGVAGGVLLAAGVLAFALTRRRTRFTA